MSKEYVTEPHMIRAIFENGKPKTLTLTEKIILIVDGEPLGSPAIGEPRDVTVDELKEVLGAASAKAFSAQLEAEAATKEAEKRAGQLEQQLEHTKKLLLESVEELDGIKRRAVAVTLGHRKRKLEAMLAKTDAAISKVGEDSIVRKERKL